MKKYIPLILNALEQFEPTAKISSTGSIYIKLTGCKVKYLRLANHNSRKLGRNVWQLRTDAMTHRGKNNNRVYSVSAIKSMIADIH